MFRIGFDPILEAEVRHGEMIREMEHIRMSEEAMGHERQINRSSIKLLAMIGRSMASLGSIIEARYGDQPEAPVGLSQRDASGDCG